MIYPCLPNGVAQSGEVFWGPKGQGQGIRDVVNELGPLGEAIGGRDVRDREAEWFAQVEEV